jgi:hypothetical protein
MECISRTANFQKWVAPIADETYLSLVLEEVIKERAGLWLGVEKRSAGRGLDVVFRLKGAGKFVLHWGLARQRPGQWQLPPEPLWPAQTRAFSQQAVQTPFATDKEEQRITVRLKDGMAAPFLVFDVFCPDTKRWENNQGRDFYLPLQELQPAPEPPKPGEELGKRLAGIESLFRKDFALDGGGELAVAVIAKEKSFQIKLLTDVSGPVALHWGVQETARAPWRLPADSIRPDHTQVSGEVSVETPFAEADGLRELDWEMPADVAPPAISFVLHTATNQWLKHRGQNLTVPIARPSASATPLDTLAARIVEGEWVNTAGR